MSLFLNNKGTWIKCIWSFIISKHHLLFFSQEKKLQERAKGKNKFSFDWKKLICHVSAPIIFLKILQIAVFSFNISSNRKVGNMSWASAVFCCLSAT